METKKFILIDHLGDDFEKQNLIERKRRIDAQIKDYIDLYTSQVLTSDQEEIVIETIHHLMTLQSHFSHLINFIQSINLN
ncbi:hypothetical protein ACUY1X_18690 [Sphingobacterium kyonggiense]